MFRLLIKKLVFPVFWCKIVTLKIKFIIIIDIIFKSNICIIMMIRQKLESYTQKLMIWLL